MTQGSASATAKKRRWFELGAGAFAQAYPGAPPIYVCPLCLMGGGIEAIDEFTYEHVPPASVGGRRLVLTCKNCNSRSGHDVDTQMRKQEDVIDFARGTLDRPIAAHLSVDGASAAVNVRVQSAGGSLLVFGVPKADKPSDREEHWAAWNKIARSQTADWKFALQFAASAYRPDKARIGWLRAGYLACFAAYGYRYVLRKDWALVRKQLLDPGVGVLTRFCLFHPDAATDTRSFSYVTEPPWLRSIAVQMGRHTVFLPCLGNPGLYESLVAQAGTSVSFEGIRLPWPSEPLFTFDLAVGPDGQIPLERMRTLEFLE
jgi:hypothetical protein